MKKHFLKCIECVKREPGCQARCKDYHIEKIEIMLKKKRLQDAKAKESEANAYKKERVDRRKHKERYK